jgi:predicted SAM-dependent methyltransferase
MKNDPKRAVYEEGGAARRVGAHTKPMSESSIDQKRVLHVGCGPKQAGKLHSRFDPAEWQELRLDIDPAVQPDIVASMTNLSIIPSASFDAVWSSHNLEHLEAHEVPIALQEFRRVLNATGFLLITLPDLQRVAELVAQDKLLETAYVSPAGPIAPLDMIFGFRKAIAAGNHFMAHRTGFTARSLGQAIVDAGFAVARIKRDDNFNLWGTAYVTRPVELSPNQAAATPSA